MAKTFFTVTYRILGVSIRRGNVGISDTLAISQHDMADWTKMRNLGGAFFVHASPGLANFSRALRRYLKRPILSLRTGTA